MRPLRNRWLPFAVVTSAALALCGLAAAHGYVWQMLWLPGAVAVVAWPRHRTRTLGDCLGGHRRERNRTP